MVARTALAEQGAFGWDPDGTKCRYIEKLTSANHRGAWCRRRQHNLRNNCQDQARHRQKGQRGSAKNLSRGRARRILQGKNRRVRDPTCRAESGFQISSARATAANLWSILDRLHTRDLSAVLDREALVVVSVQKTSTSKGTLRLR